MKLTMSRAVADALMSAPVGTLVNGTISPEYGCATATEIAGGDGEKIAGIRGPVAAVENGGPAPIRLCWIKGKLDATWRDNEPVTIEIYDEKDYFKRTPFDPEIQGHLEKEKVLVVGIGSVGAPMGLELAKAGVGEIIAVDKDRLEIHNAMRHVLGTPYVGWPKADGFAHCLTEHAPHMKCTPVFADLFGGSRSGLRNLLETHRPTRILAVTDSLRVQYICQMAAIFYDIPMMAVWCDNNAVEGEVFLWEPGQAREWQLGRPVRGCYGCLRPPDKATIGRSSHFDYSSDDPDSYGGEPALGTFINRINDIATIVMLAWMLRDAPRPTRLATLMDEYYEGKGLQYIRLGGAYRMDTSVTVTADQPWQVKWMRVLKRDKCPYCGDDANVEALLFPKDGDLSAQNLSAEGFESVAGTGDGSKGEA